MRSKSGNRLFPTTRLDLIMTAVNADRSRQHSFDDNNANTRFDKMEQNLGMSMRNARRPLENSLLDFDKECKELRQNCSNKTKSSNNKTPKSKA